MYTRKNKKRQLKIQETTNPRFLDLGFSKKGQLKIQEMAFMLVAVVLFFALVGLFVFSLLFSNVREEATRIAEERTLSAVSSIADTPELSCVASKSNCIDGDKLIGFVDNKVYSRFWPFSSLKIIKYSGFEKDENELITCSKENYPDCDLFVVYDKKVTGERAVASFAAFCRKEYENGYVYDHCELAKIIAGTELKDG